MHGGIHDHNLVFDIELQDIVGDLLSDVDKESVEKELRSVYATHKTKNREVGENKKVLVQLGQIFFLKGDKFPVQVRPENSFRNSICSKINQIYMYQFKAVAAKFANLSIFPARAVHPNENQDYVRAQCAEAGNQPTRRSHKSTRWPNPDRWFYGEFCD